eukprot:4578112-Pleurochrysis_carterae.AAC.1
MVCPDPLHAYLNVVVAVMKYGVHDRVVFDKGDDAELKAIKADACRLINYACITHRVRIKFSTDPKEPMPKINGNAWKEMTKPGFFPSIIDALRLIHQCQAPVRQSTSSAVPASSTLPASAAPVSDHDHHGNDDDDDDDKDFPSAAPVSSTMPASAAPITPPAAAPVSPPHSASAAISFAPPRPKRSPFKPDDGQAVQVVRRPRNNASAEFLGRMNAEAAQLDVEMEQHGGAQAFLDSLTEELQQAEAVTAANSAYEDPAAKPADHVAAKLEEAANSFESRFIACLYSLLEHW